jgi:hypothetical protein
VSPGERESFSPKIGPAMLTINPGEILPLAVYIIFEISLEGKAKKKNKKANSHS